MCSDFVLCVERSHIHCHPGHYSASDMSGFSRSLRSRQAGLDAFISLYARNLVQISRQVPGFKMSSLDLFIIFH
jgi:hypothetical protein